MVNDRFLAWQPIVVFLPNLGTTDAYFTSLFLVDTLRWVLSLTHIDLMQVLLYEMMFAILELWFRLSYSQFWTGVTSYNYVVMWMFFVNVH